MRAYLLWIGCANALGFVLLIGAMSDSFADGLLRRWTKIIPDDTPFQHSAYSRIWLWWAVIGTGFYAGLNIVALDWPWAYARWVVYGNIYAYAFFEVLAIAATANRKRWGVGIYVTHVLWIAQAGWGVMTALREP